MKKQFTPGPWQSREDQVYDSNGFSVASATSTYGIHKDWDKMGIGVSHWSDKPGITCIDRTEEDANSNAKLIAAAPDMYEALQKLVEVCMKYVDISLIADEYHNAQNVLDKSIDPTSKVEKLTVVTPDEFSPKEGDNVEVSDDGEYWNDSIYLFSTDLLHSKHVVINASGDGTLNYRHMRPSRSKIKISLSEIAAWRNVSKSQIEIIKD